MRPLSESLDRRLSRYPSRKGIADAALAALQPFSAKQLMSHLRQSGQVVSKATVYRTLGLLVKNNLLRESTIPRGDLLYHPLVDKDVITWICTECGAARHLPAAPLEEFLRAVAGIQGFHASRLEVQVLTRCDTEKCASPPSAGLERIWPC